MVGDVQKHDALMLAIRMRRDTVKREIGERQKRIDDENRKNPLLTGYDYGMRDALVEELVHLERWLK